jgi:hypothetical protein
MPRLGATSKGSDTESNFASGGFEKGRNRMRDPGLSLLHGGERHPTDGCPTLSVEQFLEKRLPFFRITMAAPVTVMVASISLIGSRLCLHGRFGRTAAFDDLVELAAIEPDSATLRAIIDLDSLPVAHHQRNLADGTGHACARIGHFNDPLASMAKPNIGSTMAIHLGCTIEREDAAA